MSSDGAIIGFETATGGALLDKTGFTIGSGCFGAEVGSAFFWAKHSSIIAFNCSVDSGLLACNNLIALAKETSNDDEFVAWPVVPEIRDDEVEAVAEVDMMNAMKSNIIFKQE